MRPIWYSNNAPTVATRGPSTPALPGRRIETGAPAAWQPSSTAATKPTYCFA